MSAPRKITLSERMHAVDRAHAVFAGAERAPTRASERDYLVDCLAAAFASLRLLAENEDDVRAYIDLRKRARAAGAGANAPPPARESGKPCEFPIARRAAMRCAEGAFQKFLGVEAVGIAKEGPAAAAAAAGAAADEVRRRCMVESRRDLDRDVAARERWNMLEAEFSGWLRCADEGEGGTPQ
jgi:hypothetical protein